VYTLAQAHPLLSSDAAGLDPDVFTAHVEVANAVWELIDHTSYVGVDLVLVEHALAYQVNVQVADPSISQQALWLQSETRGQRSKTWARTGTGQLVVPISDLARRIIEALRRAVYQPLRSLRSLPG
jgi:hypothetical protein